MAQSGVGVKTVCLERRLVITPAVIEIWRGGRVDRKVDRNWGTLIPSLSLGPIIRESPCNHG